MSTQYGPRKPSSSEGGLCYLGGMEKPCSYYATTTRDGRITSLDRETLTIDGYDHPIGITREQLAMIHPVRKEALILRIRVKKEVKTGRTISTSLMSFGTKSAIGFLAGLEGIKGDLVKYFDGFSRDEMNQEFGLYE